MEKASENSTSLGAKTDGGMSISRLSTTSTRGGNKAGVASRLRPIRDVWIYSRLFIRIEGTVVRIQEQSVYKNFKELKEAARCCGVPLG